MSCQFFVEKNRLFVPKGWTDGPCLYHLEHQENTFQRMTLRIGRFTFKYFCLVAHYCILQNLFLLLSLSIRIELLLLFLQWLITVKAINSKNVFQQKNSFFTPKCFFLSEFLKINCSVLKIIRFLLTVNLSTQFSMHKAMLSWSEH